MTRKEKKTLPEIEAAARSGATELLLSNRGLTRLPAEIGQLTNLQTLNLWGNGLSEVPAEIGQLTKLRKLNLANNQLSEVPAEIGQLKNLQELYLHTNQLREVPAEIWQLASLQFLNLGYGNQVREVPAEIGQLTNLRTLLLDRNQLSEMPAEIGQLMNLQRLELHNNQLREVPAEIWQLTNLRELNLSRNQLREVPAEIGQLMNLQRLELHNNQLTEVPAEIGQLTNLQHLYLHDNQLSEVPAEIGQLTNLRRLELDGNPLKSPPPEVVKQGIQAILAYLRDLPTAEKQWVSKLILVGEGGVGKTSLVKRLKDNSFDSNEPTTHGIRVEDVSMAHPSEPAVTMHLNAWDFGGQQIYHATHQFFLSERSLYLVVWNARLGWEQGKLDYWLDSIKARAPESPVLIVATHSDERLAALPFEDLRRKYPQVKGQHAVSNQSGDGIEELAKSIRGTAAGLPLMGERWPSTWLRATLALHKCREKGVQSVSPRELVNVFRRHKVTGKDADVLSTWLHELGDILYFRDNPDLDDIVILDPQWVTESISQVLESDKVVRGLGIFTRDHMREVWRELDPSVQDHFLRLMEQFDLSYRTPGNEDVSIVVERLDENPADYKRAWDEAAARPSAKEISMTFELDGRRPPGIPTWFIARQHRFTTRTHWRYGGLFADDRKKRTHLGLLETSPTGNRIRLTVRGPYPHNFFALLRDGFELTLERFKGLGVKRKIPCPGPNSGGCSHEFALEHLQGRLDRDPPKLKIECPVCYEDGSMSHGCCTASIPGPRTESSRRSVACVKTSVSCGPLPNVSSSTPTSVSKLMWIVNVRMCLSWSLIRRWRGFRLCSRVRRPEWVNNYWAGSGSR